MSTIKAAEDWLIAVIKDELGDSVDVDSGPYEFDGDYLKTLIDELPAVRVVWDGGTQKDKTGNSVDLTGEWIIAVVTGWRGKDQSFRRRGEMQAYIIVEALASGLHNVSMGAPVYRRGGGRIQDADGNDLATVEGAGRLALVEIHNEGGSQWDRVGAAIYTLHFDQQLPLELPEREGQSADWTGGRLDIDLPGVGEDTDLEGKYELEQ